MIEYDPKNWVRICFSLHGSVAPRLVPRVLLVFRTDARERLASVSDRASVVAT